MCLPDVDSMLSNIALVRYLDWERRRGYGQSAYCRQRRLIALLHQILIHSSWCWDAAFDKLWYEHKL